MTVFVHVVSYVRTARFQPWQRPLVDMELRYEIIKGNHITPLTQNVFLNTPIDSIDPLLGVRQGMKKEFLKTVNHLGQMLVDWLEESAPPVPPTSSGSNSSSGINSSSSSSVNGSSGATGARGRGSAAAAAAAAPVTGQM